MNVVGTGLLLLVALFWSAQSIPDSVDWRKKGVVPPVRNQGQCGYADLFAIVGAIDSFHAIQTGKLVLASEEEVADCCSDDPPPYPCGGCSGGLVGDVYGCVVKIGGLATEAEYSSPDCKCLNDTFKPAIKIAGGKTVQRGNETALAVAVVQQPVAALIDASHLSFQTYAGGIYDEPACSSTTLDHAVLVVGYGSVGGHDYWIAQNSWGKMAGVLQLFDCACYFQL